MTDACEHDLPPALCGLCADARGEDPGITPEEVAEINAALAAPHEQVRELRTRLAATEARADALNAALEIVAKASAAPFRAADFVRHEPYERPEDGSGSVSFEGPESTLVLHDVSAFDVAAVRRIIDHALAVAAQHGFAQAVRIVALHTGSYVETGAFADDPAAKQHDFDIAEALDDAIGAIKTYARGGCPHAQDRATCGLCKHVAEGGGSGDPWTRSDEETTR